MPKKITMSPEEHAALRAHLEAMTDDDFTVLVKPGPADTPSPANSEIPVSLPDTPAPDAASANLPLPSTFSSASTCRHLSRPLHIPS